MTTGSDPSQTDHEHEPCCEGPDSPCYICQPDAHNCSPTCRLHVTHVGPCLQAEVESERPLILSALFVIVLVIAATAIALAILD